MAKGKSSASSATRKKHAQKQAKKNADPNAPPEPPPSQKPKEKGKGKKPTRKEKEMRPKMYIAPVKPKPVQPDPLETTGLAYQLPPELLISLKSLGKKAVDTKCKGLEDLQYLWVDKVLKGENPENEYVLVDMLPVWALSFTIYQLFSSIPREGFVSLQQHCTTRSFKYLR
ncbi:hypothetical protein PQX77_000654 [Marasmius sp. AFHP31]|nr:hypothetical protein PQX77_000654 [Marasmius sp. AFHP31]